jgi:predicted phosphohydrolase
MKIDSLLWVTDIHLNFLDQNERQTFYQSLVEKSFGALLISGDIGEAPSVNLYLKEMANFLNRPIFFVLGNHDYYRGSVVDVRESMSHLTKIHENLHWLGNGEAVRLNAHTALVGVDGWADGRNGDFMGSPVLINDSRLIADLFHAKLLSKSNLLRKMQELADKDVANLRKALSDAITPETKHIIITTHVPPFPECCWFEGEPSDNDWLPYYSSKATGDLLAEFAQKHPEIKFSAFCGHTHTRHTHPPFANLTVKVGQATYGSPEIQEIVSLV